MTGTATAESTVLALRLPTPGLQLPLSPQRLLLEVLRATTVASFPTFLASIVLTVCTATHQDDGSGKRGTQRVPRQEILLVTQKEQEIPTTTEASCPMQQASTVRTVCTETLRQQTDAGRGRRVIPLVRRLEIHQGMREA